MTPRAESSTEVARNACMAPDGRGAVVRRGRLVGGSDEAALDNTWLGASGVPAEATGVVRDEAARGAGGTPCAAASRVPMTPAASRVTGGEVWPVIASAEGVRVG